MGTWLRRLFGTEAPSRPEAPAPVDRGAHAAHLAPDVDVAFCRWVLDTDGKADPPSSNVERVLLDSLRAAARDQRLANRVPRVPSVVPQLLQVMRDPARSSADVARHVAQDPVLVASVLRVANSPYYGAGRRIENLDQAVMILGHDGMRQLVAAVAFKPLINVQSGHFTRPGAPRVWEQTECAGGACRLLAPAAGASAFEAYLVTLLVNVGTIVALRVLDEHPPGSVELGSRAFCSEFVVAVHHLALQIGRQWEFPVALVAALSRDAMTSRAPLAALVDASTAASRMRVLVDAGRFAHDDAVRAIGDDARMASCFASLGAKRGEDF